MKKDLLIVPLPKGKNKGEQTIITNDFFSVLTYEKTSSDSYEIVMNSRYIAQNLTSQETLLVLSDKIKS